MRGPPRRRCACQANTHGDHILRDLLADAHSGVKPLGDDVGQAIVDDRLDFDIGISLQELGEFWPEDRFDSIVCRRDADGARWFLPKFAQTRELGLDLFEPRADGVKQALARLIWRDAAGSAG